jgi:hypothetical protein
LIGGINVSEANKKMICYLCSSDEHFLTVKKCPIDLISKMAFEINKSNTLISRLEERIYELEKQMKDLE